MKKTIFTLMSASLLLSSCGIYTKYKKADEVPQNLYGEEMTAQVSQWDATHAEADTLGLMDWRQLFTDPQLQALIEQGLERNTDYLKAQLNVEQAQAALLSAKLAYLPSLALTPQGTVSSFDKMKATQTYQLPVAASWELDLFGRLRNAKRQSQAQLAMTKDYQQATRAAIIAGIANTYYTLLMLDEQLSITRQTSEAWKETVRSARALMAAGQNPGSVANA